MILPKGIGIHVFAGGFTMGMKTVLPVTCQLEIHNFGRGTCESIGTPFLNSNNWEEWFDYNSTWNGSQFCYGNPRCTSFSSYSSGCRKEVRGPTAYAVQDIWDLCHFATKAELDLISFENVQQITTVGKSLLNTLRDEVFIPKHYRIAHVFVNTAAEGNAQKRRRYFFVAYRDDKNFNVYKPVLPEYRITVGDILSKPEFINIKPYYLNLGASHLNSYDANACHKLSEESIKVIPYLKEKEGFNTLAKRRPEELQTASKKLYDKWLTRCSNLPFSLHAPTRLKWTGACPTICSTSRNLIHPRENRTLTVGEIAALMGWPSNVLPIGPNPIGQIGKGVVPATGAWLSEQIAAYFRNDWGKEDFDAKYCHHSNIWYGTDYTGSACPPTEKTFHMTYYLPPEKELVTNE